MTGCADKIAAEAAAASLAEEVGATRSMPADERGVGAGAGVAPMRANGARLTRSGKIKVRVPNPSNVALFAVLASADYAGKLLRLAAFIVNAVLAVGLVLEAVAFSGEGFSPISQIAGLVIAPVVSVALVALSSKIKNKKALAIAVCVASIVGVAIARYAFYATCTVA